MNQVNPMQQFRTHLSKMKDQFAVVLPHTITPDSFIRIIITAVQNNPDLLNCNRESLIKACMKCAEDGLVPDGRQAALVKFRTKINNQFVDAAQYMPMFSGILRRVRNSREVSTVHAHVIYKHDHFVWFQGTEDRIEHRPLFPGDRGEPIGAYAIALMKDGSRLFEVMNIDQLNKIKKASKTSGWGPWKDWWDEMARKTVFKRLAKWLPLDASVNELIDYDNRVDQGEVINHQPQETTQTLPAGQAPVQKAISAPSSKLDALDGLNSEDPRPEPVEVEPKQQQQQQQQHVQARFADIGEDDF